VIDAAFWRDCRVLITGHTGFKGSWLAIWLRSLGAEIAGYALEPPTAPSLFEAADVGACLADHRGDVRDVAAVRSVVAAFDPQVVFHLAAQSLVRQGYRDPVETYATNVVGAAAVLDACRRAPSLRAVVCITSDKCYENREWVWGYRESDRLGGFDPYSSSKACVEIVTDAFRRSYFDDAVPQVGIATARAGNVIGGGDWAEDRLVPDLARAVAAGHVAIIRNPRAVRPWQHVVEPLAGYITLAQRLGDDPRQYSGAWNFGPAASSLESVEAVVALLGDCWQGRLRWSIDSGKHPHEAGRLTLESSKAANGLKWTPRLALKDSLRLTAEWYDAYQANRGGLRKLTEAQIAYYSRCAA
jgi:CDP-glucose 4,6-dehydratase